MDKGSHWWNPILRIKVEVMRSNGAVVVFKIVNKHNASRQLCYLKYLDFVEHYLPVQQPLMPAA